MGHDPKDFVEQLVDASVEAKLVLHELQIAIKESNKVLANIANAMERLATQEIRPVVTEVMDKEMEKMAEEIKVIMDGNVEDVTREFNRLTRVLLTAPQSPIQQVSQALKEEISTEFRIPPRAAQAKAIVERKKK